MRRITVLASSWLIWSATVRASSARKRHCAGSQTNFRGWHSQELLRTKPCFGLHRVHWGEEASSYWFVLVYWSTPAIKISYFIKGTMVKAFIRGWCCHVGGNNFITLW